jgi:hypothetical protein
MPLRRAVECAESCRAYCWARSPTEFAVRTARGFQETGAVEYTHGCVGAVGHCLCPAAVLQRSLHEDRAVGNRRDGRGADAAEHAMTGRRSVSAMMAFAAATVARHEDVGIPGYATPLPGSKPKVALDHLCQARSRRLLQRALKYDAPERASEDARATTQGLVAWGAVPMGRLNRPPVASSPTRTVGRTAHEARDHVSRHAAAPLAAIAQAESAADEYAFTMTHLLNRQRGRPVHRSALVAYHAIGVVLRPWPARRRHATGSTY